MMPERWERLQTLLISALELERDEREDYLTVSCEGDPALREEVESLISGHEAVGPLDRLADDLVRPLAVALDAAEDLSGTTVAQYEIESRLGGGGMGIVYRARDTKLGCTVALKFLPPHLGTPGAGRERFLVEAQVAARLDHPNICMILEIGETEDGRLFIAMPFYERGTLKKHLVRQGILPVDEAVSFALQVARGLAAVHERGVVHRDIKPANLILAGEDVVKIVDFGIAKLADVSLTLPGQTPGTTAYMSPEQASGDEVDHRTDLWSLGVVLHEMLAGRRPFAADRREPLLHAIRSEEPPPLRSLRPEVPPDLDRIVTDLLAKEPEKRLPTADRLVEDLEAIAAGTLRPASPRLRSRGLLRSPLGRAAALVLTLAGLGGLYGVLSSRARESPPVAAPAEDARPAIAVLPFTVRGEGLEVWREGMVDLLSTNLEGVAGLRTISSSSVLARWSVDVGGDLPAALPTALSVANRAGAQYAIAGTVIASGPTLRLNANLYDVGTAEILAQVQANGSPDDIPRLVDELSLDIMRVIGAGAASGVPRFDLAGTMSGSIDAIKAYLAGEAHLRRSEFESAANAFEEAVAMDSTFAFAHYRLVYAYGSADGRHGPRVREAAERAQRLVEKTPDLPLAVQLWLKLTPTTPEVLRLAQRAVREHPDDASLWNDLGDIYAHFGGRLLAEPGSEAKAMARAIELDPGLTNSYLHVISSSYRLDPDSAQISALIDREEANGLAAREVQLERVVYAIAFGDSAARTMAYRALDGFWLTPGRWARWNLSHPLFLPQRAEVFRIASQRTGEYLEPAFSDWLVVRTALDRGRIAEALQELGNRGLLESLRLPAMYRAYAQGLPVPASAFNSVLRIVVADTVMDPQPGYELLSDGGTRTPLFYTAAYAISEGVPSSAADAARRLRAAAQHHREAGDSTKVRIALGTAKALQALDAWKIRDDLIEARRLLEEVQAGELFDQWQENRVVRWWLGELLVESGELREAVPYYVSLVEGEPSGLFDPPAAYRLGQVHEQLGEKEKARHSYEYVLLAWRDADPELQPWIETAREGLDRLSAADQ